MPVAAASQLFPLLVQPLRISHIADFLSGGGDGTPSAFERFGIREPDGSFCTITSHQVRHWLNYIADKGGLPVDLQSRWMGREHSRDTEAYRHATVDERLEWVKAGIQEGKLAGPKANIYFELPTDRRNWYLEGQVQAVHFTPLGVCEISTVPRPTKQISKGFRLMSRKSVQEKLKRRLLDHLAIAETHASTIAADCSASERASRGSVAVRCGIIILQKKWSRCCDVREDSLGS